MPQRSEKNLVFQNKYVNIIYGRFLSGSGQASVIAYDIQSNIKKNWLVEGLRSGWNENLRTVMINYKGQWYQFDKKDVFDENIYKILK